MNKKPIITFSKIIQELILFNRETLEEDGIFIWFAFLILQILFFFLFLASLSLFVILFHLFF